MKKLLLIGLLTVFSVQPVLGGRSAFAATATIENMVHYDRWLTGEIWDVYMKGADGKWFMLHFHDQNPLTPLRAGQTVNVVYVQEENYCQTGYIDKVISLEVK